MNGKEEYKKSENEFKNLLEKKLKPVNPYLYDGIVCLLNQNDLKSAFLLWYSYKNKLKISLAPEEEKVVEEWYWFFGK